jgi:hypothetical protein
MPAPLFNIDLDTLKGKLRLSGTAQADAEAIIEQKLSEVRVGFYDSLGVSRIGQLLAIPLEDSPTTAAGIMRLKAANTEVQWIKLLLFRALPTMFIDSSGSALQVWNEEGFTRQASQSDLSREINRLQAEVNDALKDLKGNQPVDAGVIEAATIGPACPPPRPFGSLDKINRRKGVFA